MVDTKHLYLMNVFYNEETSEVEYADRTLVEGYVEGDAVPEGYWLSLGHQVIYDFMLA